MADEKQVTKWGDPADKVVASLRECTTCGAIEGHPHFCLTCGNPGSPRECEHDDRCKNRRYMGRRVASSYGSVTYREWCEKEQARLAAHGRTVTIAEAGGKIALMR